MKIYQYGFCVLLLWLIIADNVSAQTWSSSYRQQVIERFAPELRFQRTEDNFPSSVEFFLQRSRLLFDDHVILNFGQVNSNSLISQFTEGQHSGGYPSEFELDANNNNSTRLGDFDNMVLYAHVRESPRIAGHFDIQYWIFYPWNATIASHEGDWEHVTVTVSPDGQQLVEMFFSSHGRGTWYSESDLTISAQTGHPVVYVDTGSHQNRNHQNGTVGRIWTRFGDVIEIGEPHSPLNNAVWLSFGGLWGLEGGNNPIGPAMKENWYDDDENPAFREGIQFWGRNNCSGGVKMWTTDEPVQDVKLKDREWPNDKFRSMSINNVLPGTRIRVYDSPSASTGDDYSIITVNENYNGNYYCVDSFERSFNDSSVRQAFREKNGLDDKVSRIKIDFPDSGDGGGDDDLPIDPIGDCPPPQIICM